MILSEDGLNQAKRLPVVLHHRALEDQLTISNLSGAVPADVEALVSGVVFRIWVSGVLISGLDFKL